MSRHYSSKGDPKGFAPDFEKNPEPYGQPIKEILLRFNELKPGAHIVDIAGGYGKYGMPLLRMGFKLTILDIHQASLDEAYKRAKAQGIPREHLSTIKVDVLRDEIPNMKDVDGVLCTGFMHHLARKTVVDLFRIMATMLNKNGLLVIEFSTNKHRRYPDGRPILVDGAPEYNSTYEEGMELMKQLYAPRHFNQVQFEAVSLRERQLEFWYDAKMIVASGHKK